MTTATKPTRQEYESITFRTTPQRPSRKEYEATPVEPVAPKPSTPSVTGIYGAFDVWAAPSDSEIWKSPGADFVRGFGQGWMRQTQVPALMGKKLPPPITRAEKIGEVAGQAMEVITEFIALGAWLKGIGMLSKVIPKSAWAAERALQTGFLFATQQATEEARKATAEAVYGEDFGSRGGIAILESFTFGAILSIASSGIGKVWNRLKPSEQKMLLRELGLKKGATLQQIDKAAKQVAAKSHFDFGREGMNPAQIRAIENKFKQSWKRMTYIRDRLKILKSGDIIKASSKQNFKKQLMGKTGVSSEVADVAIKRLDAGESITKVDQMISQAKAGVKPLITAPPTAFEPSTKALAKRLDLQQVEVGRVEKGEEGIFVTQRKESKIGEKMIDKAMEQAEAATKRYEDMKIAYGDDSPQAKEAKEEAIRLLRRVEDIEEDVSLTLGQEPLPRVVPPPTKAIVAPEKPVAGRKAEIAPVTQPKGVEVATSIIPESLRNKKPHEIHWGIAVNDQIVISGTMVGTSEDHLAELAKGHNGRVVFADKSFSKKQEVGDIFGMTFEQIKAKQQKITIAKPKAVEVEKEIKYEKEAITEPTPSPEVEPREAGELVPTGKLDPTNAEEALEITQEHAQWVAWNKDRTAWEGINTKKWDEKLKKDVIDSVVYTPEQINEAYRTIQKPVESPMPDTDLFAMPGKEAQMKAIAQKMAKVKGVVKPKKVGPKPLTTPTALPKAKTKIEDHIKAIYAVAAKEATKYAINGLKVEGDTIIATDGRRMFWAKGKWGKDGLYLDATSLKKGSLGKLDKTKQKFPTWRDIVPEVSKRDAILVEDLDTVLRHIRQAASMTTEESKGVLIIENKDGSLGFSAAAPEIGHVEINVMPGSRILGGVNPHFLMDAIKFHAIRGDTGFEFYFSDPTRVMMTRSLDGKTSTLISPINIEKSAKDIAIAKAISEGEPPAPVKPEMVEVKKVEPEKFKELQFRATRAKDPNLERELKPFAEGWRVKESTPEKYAELEAKVIKAEAKFKPKGKPGFIDVRPLLKVHKTFMGIVEPSKAVELKLGKEPYAAVIKGVHEVDVGRIEFNEAQIEGQDKSLSQMSQWFSKFSDKDLKNFMISRGTPRSEQARRIQYEARGKLPKELQRGDLFQATQRIADSNYKYLQSVVGDDVHRVEDYFYGIWKNPKKVDKLLDYWHTTKRFTKEKKLPTVADAMDYDSTMELRSWNPIENLKAEYIAISHLEGMNWMKNELLRIGKGKYIDSIEDAPMDWEKVQDPVFKDLRLQPDLAKLINNLIATNKISRIPILNTLREINNVARTIKFVGSAFHLLSVAKQSVADSGYLGFLYKPTALRGFTRGFRANDPIFRTTAYKDYIRHGGGHRYSVESEARRAFTGAVNELNRNMGIAIKAGALPLKIPVSFVNWMFQSYIPKVKYSKFLDVMAEKEKKFGRKLTSPEKIDIIKEQQNFYGMMNERLFGRSGTVTSAMRFYFMSPGYAEGNYRTMLKAATQWGGKSGVSANRSRSNIINSWLITGIAATVGTLAFTGKPPKKPEELEDARDLFKIDTGKVDEKGRRIMIDLMTYDKDYWNVAFNILRLRPDVALGKSWRRIGGMKAPTAEMIHDLIGMTMGKAIMDWKNDEVYYLTDPFLLKAMKLTAFEIKKLSPISVSVFQQSKKRDIDTTIAAIETLLGFRPTKTEKDIREQKITSKMYSLAGQKEVLSYYIGESTDPKESVRVYNKTVNDILNSPYTPKAMKDKWSPRLLIEYDKVVTWKRFPAAKMTNAELSRAYDAHTLSVPYKRRGEPFRMIGEPKKGSEKRVEQLKTEAKKRGIVLKRGPRKPPRM